MIHYGFTNILKKNQHKYKTYGSHQYCNCCASLAFNWWSWLNNIFSCIDLKGSVWIELIIAETENWKLRLRLVRVKAFPENRYFPEMLFSGKENVFMCLVAFQKNFRKIFSHVWLYSWKYHKKHIFYLLLTFSHIFSAPKQTHNVIHS